MRIVYHFRKPSPVFHSLEEVFGNVQSFLSSNIEYSNYYMRYESRGIFKRLGNILLAMLHQQEITHVTGDIHYAVLFLRKNRTILTIHDLGAIFKGHWLRRKIIKLFWYTLPIARVKYVTVISEFTKQELMKNIKVNPAKVKVIHNCVSPLLKYSEKQDVNDEFTILQIGTKENKNLENLVKATLDIPYKLIIVGKLNSVQLKLMKESKINYEQHSDIEFSAMIELYKRADLVAFVSTYEGFGMPILEANTIGRPVIAGNVSSMPEIAGDAAYLVDPNNVAEIRKGILELIKNKELRENLVAKGLKNAERFTGQKIARAYQNLYEQMIAENY